MSEEKNNISMTTPVGTPEPAPVLSVSPSAPKVATPLPPVVPVSDVSELDRDFAPSVPSAYETGLEPSTSYPSGKTNVIARYRRYSKWIVVAALFLLIPLGAVGYTLFSRSNQPATINPGDTGKLAVTNLTDKTRTNYTVNVNGNLKVQQQTTLNQLTVTGDASFGGIITAQTINTDNLNVAGRVVVAGDIQAGNFSGNGSGLTGVNAATLGGYTVDQILSLIEAAEASGREGLSEMLEGYALLDGNNIFTGVNIFSDNVTFNGINTYTAAQIFNGTTAFNDNMTVQGNISGESAAFAGSVSAQQFTQDGHFVCDSSGNCLVGGGGSIEDFAFVQGGNNFGVTSVLGSQDNYDLTFITNNTTRMTISQTGDVIVAGALTANTFTGNGVGLNNLNASNLSSGTVPDARLSTNIALRDQPNTFTGINDFSNIGNTFTGDGTGLINVDAALLGGQSINFFRNAANLNAGTLDDLRLSSNVTLQGNTFNGASELVQLNASGALPALDGSNLSNVNAALLQGYAASYFTDASNLSSGTLDDARLSSNIPLKNASNTFTGASNVFVGLSATSILQNGNQVCDTSGNCLGSGGGGGISGSGTPGAFPIFDSAYTLIDSIVSQASTTITVAGTLNAVALQGDGSLITDIDADNITAGTVSVARGGTGVGTFTANGLLYGNGSGAIQVTNAGSTGQCLVGSTGGAPTWMNCVEAATGTNPGGIAGGDLGGTYPNPVVTGLNGTALAVSSLAADDFLLFNGVNWVNLGVSGDITITGGVATIVDGVVTNAKLVNSALSVNAGTGLSGGGSIALGASTSLSVIYGSTAGTAVEGDTTLICPTGTGNLAGGGDIITLGNGGSCSNLDVIANPAFTSLTLTNALTVGNGGTGANNATDARTNLGAAASGANSDITSLIAVTSVGSTSNTLTLQGNASTTLSVTDSGFVTSVGFAAPTANINYLFADAVAGTYDICTTAGNCVGTGGSISGVGTADTIAMFTGTGTIGNSLLSQSGSTVTVAGTLVATALQGSGAAITNLNGTNIASGTVGVSVGGTGANSFTANGVIFGNGTGALQVTVAGVNGECLVGSTGSSPTWMNCATAAAGATPGGPAGGDLGGSYPSPTVVGLYGTPLSVGALTAGDIFIFDGTNWINAAVSGDITVDGAGVATIANAAVTNAKLANSAVTVSAGTGLSGGGSVSLGATTTLNVVFGSTSGTSVAGNTTLVCPVGIGNLSGGGNTITLGAGGTCDSLSVSDDPIFNSLTLTNALSVANGGTGATNAGGARANLGAAASGINSDITSITGLTTALSAGQGGTGVDGSLAANGQLLIGTGTGYTLANLAQGSGISITNGSGSITIGIDATVCTTSGNCAGVSGGVTTPGGTAGAIPIFTAGQVIEDSIITQSGSVITVAGTLAATALQGDGSLITGLNASNLASGTVASARISGSYAGITAVGALTGGSIGTGFGVISTTNAISTTAALQGNTLSIGSGAFAVSSGGAITAATGITSSGAIVFSSLNAVGVVHTDINGQLSTSAVILGTDTSGSFVANLGTLTGLTTTGNSGAGSTPTLSVTYGAGVNTAAQGNTALSFTGTGNLTGSVTGTAGGGFSSNTLNVVSNPTFTGLLSADGGLTTTDIAFSGNLTQSGGGTITFGSFGAGIVQSDGAGELSSGSLSRNSSLLTGQTSVANGGTGATTASGARTNLGAAASGANSDITSLSAVTSVGGSGALTLQGNASTVLNASDSGFTTSVGFAAPTANITYLFADAVAGTYDICTTSGNCVGVGGSITGTGTADTIAMFTGSGTIGNSLLSQSGTTVTVAGTLAATALQGSGASITNLNGTNIASGTVGVSVGGTGANSFTSYGVIYGNGTGALGVTAAGITGDCLLANTGGAPTWGSCAGGGGGSPGGPAGGDLGGTYPNPQVVGLYGTPLTIGTLSAGNILVFDGTDWINAAVSGDLSVNGAGVATIANGAVTNAKLANSAVTVTAGTGLSGGGSVSLGGSTSLSVAYGATSTTAARGDITIICSAGVGNLGGGGNTITIGTGGTCADLTVTDDPIFNSLTLTTALSVANGGTGATTASGARTNLGAAKSGANSDITSLTGLTTALSVGQGGTGVNGATAANGTLLIGNGSGYTLANLTQGSGISITNGAGSITIGVDSTVCTTSGNCTGVGGAVSTSGGTTNTIAMFTGTQTVGDSILTQSGTVISVAGTLSATALQGDGSGITNLNASNLASGTVASARISGSYTGITGVGALTAGSIASGFGSISTTNNISTAAQLQGNTLAIASGTFAVNSSGVITTAAGITSSGAISFSSLNAVGVVHTDSFGNLSTSAVVLGVDTSGSFVANLGMLTGLTTTGNSGAGSTPTLSVTYGATANTAAQGNTALSFTGAGNLTGGVSGTAGGGFTINTLNVVSNPTFSGLITGNGGLATTTLTASSTVTLSSLGAGIVQADGSGVLSSGSISRNSSLLTGQTSVANGGTGSTTASGARTNLGAAASGANTDITSLANVTSVSNSAGALAVGNTGQTLTLQGNASTVISATDSGFVTAVGFAVPTANVNYRFAAATAGTYDICTTSGNCAGVSGGVTTAGGTTNTIAMFTGSQVVGDSILTQSGTTITVGGTLAATTLQGSGASITNLNGTNIASGTVGVSVGGTGRGTFTSNGIIYGNGTGGLNVTVAGVNGQCLVGTTGSSPTWANCATAAAGAVPGGPAGGDLGGSYPNPTVVGIYGTALSITSLTNGNIMTYNGTNWVNASSISLSGNASFGGTLAVTGHTTLSTLGVSGAATVGSTLAVTGAATFGSTLTATGNITTGGLLVEKSVTFTPTTIGWYRVVLHNGAQAGGMVRIYGGYDNRFTDVELQYNIGGYGTDGSVQQTRFSSYNGGMISQARISSDGSNFVYLDIYVSSATAPGPINLYGYGPSMPSFVASPVVGATVGSTNARVLTLGHGFRTTNGATFAETSGGVGIGTASPNWKVDIQGGDLNVSGDLRTGSQIRITSAGLLQNVTYNGNAVGVSYGGTGATNAAGARTNLGAAASGANSDITSITGLTTALSVGQGGTGINGATAANGRLLIGNGSGYTLANLTQGTGINISNGSGSITIGIDSTVCTTGGNCAGVGGGVTTPGGTANTIAMFTGSGTIGNSVLSQSGSTINLAGTLAVTGNISGATLSGTGLTVTGNGSFTGNLTVNGTATIGNQNIISLTRTLPTVVNDEVDLGSFALTNGAGSIVVDVTVPSSGFSAAKHYVIPIGYASTSGTWQVVQPLSDTGAYATNNFALDINVNAGTASLRLRRVAGTTAGTAYITIIKQGVAADVFTASTATSSVSAPTVTYSASTLTQVGGNVSTTGTLTASSTSSSVFGNGTTGQIQIGDGTLSKTSGSGFSFNSSVNASTLLQTAGTTRIDASGILQNVTYQGNAVGVGYGGTGATTAAGARTNLGAAASGANSDITSLNVLTSINNSSALTIGNTGQTLLLQGNASTSLAATSGSFTTSVGFGVPSANVNYRFVGASAGTYDVCTTAGNCAGVGGGVTTVGGTNGTIAMFTGSQAIANSILTQSGSVINIAGSLSTGGTVRLDGSGNLSNIANLTYSGTIATTAIGNIVPFEFRGNGNNNYQASYLRIGSNSVYASSGRGLTLTIVNRSNYSVVSTNTYDTFASSTASDNLATAMNAITTSQIGILTSSDSWEPTVTTNLKSAFLRLGLTKAHAISNSGQTHMPYAAVFASSNSAAATTKVTEIAFSNDANVPTADVRGWFVDGDFVATNTVANSVTNATGTSAALYADYTGNIGIGTTSTGSYKLNVAGSTNSTTIYQNGNQVCDASNNCGYTLGTGGAGYIQNGTTPQSANYNITGTAVIGSTLTVGNEIIGTSATQNQFRAVGGNYGTMFRQDGSDFYLLSTNSGNQLGTWNSLRPFSFNNSTGTVNLANGALYALQSSGRVGIGTASPSTTLEVNGTLTVTGSIIVGGDTIGDFNGSGLSVSSGVLSLDYDATTRNLKKTVTVAAGTAAAGNYYDLWSISRSEPSSVYHIDVNTYGSGIGGTRSYVLDTSYANDIYSAIGGANGNYAYLTSLSSSQRSSSPNHKVEVLVSVSASTITLRLFLPTTPTGTYAGIAFNVGVSLTEPLNFTTAGTVTSLSSTGTGMAAPTATIPLSFGAEGGSLNIGTRTPITGVSLNVQGGNINTSGNLMTGGTTRISSTGAGTLTTLSLSGVLTSTVTTGTAPLTVASTTLVTNLNADMLDGLHASSFAPASGSSNYIQLQATTPGTAQTGHLNITGTAIAGSFSGNGANLTALDATQLTTGTVPIARISGSYTGITGTGALNAGTITSGFGTIDTGDNITGAVVQGTRFVSTQATGTAPLTVASTTVVSSLNADMLDGQHASAFAAASGSANYINNTTSPQTANFNITGNGTIGGTLQLNSNNSNTSIAGRTGEFVLQNSNSTTNAYTLIQANSPSGVIASGIQFVNVNPGSNYGRIDLQTRGASGYLVGLSVLNGNVGIGTTGPGARLEVNAGSVGGTGVLISNNDALSFRDSGSAARRVLLVSAGNTTYLGPVDASWGTGTLVSAGTDLSVRVNGSTGTFTTALFAQGSTGNVGIGTSGPGQRLDVQGGNINTSGNLMTGGTTRISSTGAGTLTTLSLSGVLTSTVTTGTAPFTVASTTAVTNLNADLLDGQHASAFAASSGSANYINNTTSPQTANFNITGNGTVGGTLTVASTTQLLNGDNSTGGTNKVQIAFGYNGSTNYGSYIVTRHNGGSAVNNAIDFYTGNGTLAGVFPTHAVHGLSINNGQVGIGTTGPGQKLDVQGGNINTSGNLMTGGVTRISSTGAATFTTVNASGVITGIGSGLTGTGSSFTAGAVTDGMYLSSAQTVTGRKYFLTNKGAASYSGSNSDYNLQAYSNDGGAAALSFHRSGSYAVNMGLDPDNVLRIGGWSASANRWQLDMAGNETLAGSLNAVGGNFSSNVTTAGSYQLGGITAIEQGGGYLRINQTSQFGNGIWLGTSVLRASTGGAYFGSAGGDGNVAILTHVSDQTRRITLDGSAGNLTVLGRFISTVSTGTAPLTVSSTTAVTNLNADLLDGQHASAFAPASGSANYINNTTSPQTANFNITGNGTLGGNLYVNAVQAVSSGFFGGSVDVSGDLSAYNDLFVDNSAYIYGSAQISGGLQVGATSVLNGGAEVNTTLRVNTSTPVTYVRSATVGGQSFGSLTSTAAGGSPFGVAAADFNGDGQKDVVASVYASAKVRVVTDPTDTFGGYTEVTTGTNPYGTVAVDIDGDGDIDIITANAGSNNISVIKNNGNGSFATKVDYATGTSPYIVAAGDIDNDGDIDLAVNNYSSSSVSVFKNNGNGTFAAKVDYTTGTNANSVTMGDFNGDGYLDLASANYTANSISVFINTGTGAYAAKVDYTAGTNAYDLKAGDLDGDGDIDLAVVNAGANTVSIFMNNGNGTFATKVDYATGSGPRNIDIADIDFDGDLDLGITNFTANTVSILKNNGNGTFATKVDYATGTDPRGIQFTDLYDSGKLDMIVAASGTTNYYVLANLLVVARPAESSTGTLSVVTNSASTGGIYIKGVSGQTASYLTIQSAAGNNLLSFDAAGNLRVSGTITGGVASPDYAENIGVSDGSIEAADVVTMDPSDSERAVKAATPYDSKLLGVISTSPGFLTNATSVDDASADDQRPLALSGRVPVKVSTINGVIRQGDYLTSSTIPGFAMKATGPGAVIGVAMADFDGTQSGSYDCGSGVICGKVQMFINPSATNPAGQNLVMQGGDAVVNALTVNGALNATSINVGGLLSADTLTVSGNASIGGDLTVVGVLRTADIIVGGHIITAGDAPVVVLNGAFDTNNVIVSVVGNDTSGTITISANGGTLFNDPMWPTTLDMTNGVSLASINFSKQFTAKPRIILSSANANAARMGAFTGGEAQHKFEIYANNLPANHSTYTFTYWAAQ